MYRALLLLWPLATSAQTTGPEPFSSIEGRVLNVATGEPVGKVSLLLMRIDASPASYDWTRSYSTSSDSTGKFAIGKVDPGKYRLRASRNGFVTLEYGARASRPSGAILDLEQPQQLKDVDFRLTQHGVITGRVLDSDGEPLARAQVQLLRSQYLNGKKVLATINTANTNDLGEYRWSGLTPGRYYLYAQNFEGSPPTAVVIEDYVPVYYPGVTSAAGAVPMDVASGTQVQAADMILRKARTATVKGRVVIELAGARGLPSVSFWSAAGHNNFSAGSFHGHSAKVNAKGEFEIRSLAPGSYTAQAEIGKDGRSHTNWVPVEVAGTVVEGIVITIGTGVSITGRIRVDGDTTRHLQSTNITLQPGGPSVAPSTSGFWTSRIAQDRTFKIESLDPQLYGVLVGGLPDGFYTKSIRVGGTDVTYSGVDLTSGSPGQVDILVSPKAAQVAGSVQNPSTNQPARGATVVLVPKEKERQGIFALYQQTTADQHGRFTFKSVVPGEYKVYAWEDVESSAWMDPEFMKPLEGKGESVTVGESAQLTVSVDLIPADSEK